MTNKNYIAGRNLEYEAMMYFKQCGTHYPIRTAGSHSMFDVIAIPIKERHSVILAQCKRYSKSKPMPSKEFIDFKTSCLKMWIIKKKGARKMEIIIVE